MDLKYLLKIFIVFLLVFSVIIFMRSLGFNLNDNEIQKKLLKVVTVEGLENPLLSDSNKSFCNSNKGYELEKACNNLTNFNCNSTSCCVWTSENKCKAGDINGSTFNTDSNGKTILPDYFYFQNKCYGEKCAKS